MALSPTHTAKKYTPGRVNRCPRADSPNGVRFTREARCISFAPEVSCKMNIFERVLRSAITRLGVFFYNGGRLTQDGFYERGPALYTAFRRSESVVCTCSFVIVHTC